MDGKEHWRALKIQADEEGLNAPFVIEALRAFKVELARDTYAILQLTRTRDDCSTFAELFAAYRQVCAGRSINPITMERNIKDMRLIIRAIHGKNFSVDTARLSLCTLDLLIDFRAKRTEEFKAKADAAGWDPEIYKAKLRSARVTIKSTIGHARSLFAQVVRQERAYRDLSIPEISEFMAFQAGGGTTREFIMPKPEVIAALKAGAEEFLTSNPPLWFALVLTANGGLRRGSAKYAKWDWFNNGAADGSAIMRVAVAKRGTYTTGISPRTWAAMKEHRLSPSEYILPGDLAERDEVLEELKIWLREIGYQENRCPVHELRGLYGNTAAKEHGLQAASEGLGHRDQRTTRDSYVEHGTAKFTDAV